MTKFTDAQGTVKIKSSSYETSKKLLSIFEKWCSRYMYNICFSVEDSEKVDEETLSTSFLGFGDCLLITELRDFGKRLEENAEAEEIEFLTSTFWECTFEYVDYDPNTHIFGRGSDMVRHIENAPLENTVLFELSWNSIPETIWNIFSILNWDLDMIVEDCGLEEVLDGNESIARYADDVYQFMEDCVEDSNYSGDDGDELLRDIISKHFPKFSKLLSMADEYSA